MITIISLVLLSFFICAAVTPLVRRVSLHWGILDAPDGIRKRHGRTVPRAGGLALPVGYLGAIALLLATPAGPAVLVRENLNYALAILPAAGIVFAIGLADDILNLRPGQKMAGQLAAAVWAFVAGVRIPGFSEYIVATPVSFVMTVVWLVVCTNAFNLIDGIDGLTAGAGFLAAVTMMVAAYLQDNVALAIATAPLAGSLLGILIYNINPASIFLGDCGSLTVGFMLGCFGVVWSQKSATVMGMAAPLIALGFPLLDTTLAVARRFLRLRPISSADRAHIHHRLLDRGLTPRRVAFLLFGACSCLAGLSLTVSFTQGRFAGLVVAVFCGAVWFGISRLRYREFHAARRVLFQRFRRVLDSELTVVSFEERMAAAKSVDECWEHLVHLCDEFGFARVRLVIGARVLHQTLRPVDPSACWSFRIPLSDHESIEFLRPFRSEFQASAAVPFFDLARTSLRPSLERFQEKARPAGQALFAEAGAE